MNLERLSDAFNKADTSIGMLSEGMAVESIAAIKQYKKRKSLFSRVAFGVAIGTVRGVLTGNLVL